MAFAANSGFLSRHIITQNPKNDFNNRAFDFNLKPHQLCFDKPFLKSFKAKIRALAMTDTWSFDAVAEREFRERGFLGLRKTKLVCTIGPACSLERDLESLALGGMNVARFNMCHNTRDWHREMIRKIKRLNEERGFCVSVMIDTEGSQLHVVDHGALSTVKAEVRIS